MNCVLHLKRPTRTTLCALKSVSCKTNTPPLSLNWVPSCTLAPASIPLLPDVRSLRGPRAATPWYGTSPRCSLEALNSNRRTEISFTNRPRPSVPPLFESNTNHLIDTGKLFQGCVSFSPSEINCERYKPFAIFLTRSVCN